MSTATKTTFKAWLADQRDRDDEVGDLASDVARDVRLSHWQWDGSLRGLLFRITFRNGCSEAREAAKKAWQEFKGKAS